MFTIFFNGKVRRLFRKAQKARSKSLSNLAIKYVSLGIDIEDQKINADNDILSEMYTFRGEIFFHIQQLLLAQGDFKTAARKNPNNLFALAAVKSCQRLLYGK